MIKRLAQWLAVLTLLPILPVFVHPVHASYEISSPAPAPASKGRLTWMAAESDDGLTAEARFYELEPIEFSFQTRQPTFDLTSSPARVMVSFHPAKKMGALKPLFVFINGGPGCPTTIGLLGMNTSPYTLDEDRVRGARIKENPYSWTEMGNLLYIDAPNTGFSYMLGDHPDSAAKRAEAFDVRNFNVFIDAAQVTRVLLRFLDDHPVLQNNPVVLVGESYSGTRTTTMINLLLNYQAYGDGSRIFQDAALTSIVQKHLDAIFPEDAGKRFNQAEISRQFGRQVLIEPELTGEFASNLSGEMLEARDSLVYALAKEKRKEFITCAEGAPGIEDEPCLPYANALAFVYLQAGRDLYFYTKPSKYGENLDDFAMQSILRTDVFTKIMGTDPTLIPELAPEARTNAFRYKDDRQKDLEVTIKDLLPPGKGGVFPTDAGAYETRPEPPGTTDKPLEDVLGKLPEHDDYYGMCNMSLYRTFYTNKVTKAGYRIDPESPLYGELFLNNLPFVRVFITDAAQDLMIYAPAIPPSFEKYTDLVKRVDLARGTQENPDGFFTIYYKEDALKGYGTPSSRTIYFPHYEPAGHAVSVAQPEKLRDDVREWLSWVAD